MVTQNHWLGRQGDVLLTTHVYNDDDELVPVDPPTEQAVDVPRASRGVVLQEGMVTGHAHHIPGDGAALTREPSGARKLEVAGPEPLEHDEHDTVEIPPGIFAVGIQVEHVPGELPRQVED